MHRPVIGPTSARAGSWRDSLELFGFDVIQAVINEKQLEVSATWPRDYGGVSTKIDVDEIWLCGDDPDQLALELSGYYLAQLSWHARIGGKVTPMRSDLMLIEANLGT